MKDFFVSLMGKPDGIILFQLIEATQYTIYLSLIAFVGGGLLGGLITLMRVMPSKTTRGLAISYIWLFQSTPLLMLLFLTGLGVPALLGINVNPWVAAIFSLTMYSSAYLADVWRGAIESVPQGQWEGARAIGMGFFITLRKVVLPQALRIALAPTVGFMVQIIKGTSLAYIIGFHDLMAIGKRWANAPVEGSEPFIIFPLMALIYFTLCYPLSLWSRWLEKRLGSTSKKAA
ncbi:amino acid ABC transporter permease [Pacificibacter marinus]|uniref:Inner membrane amino-acid ABC transporter permease protein YecS n=1 Tax=Pacificibacter marinus TaxID=658057 RepID=A0A1Y5TDT7_9RHOB|nr:amino acid ABC transporter permease [Pacificibacter marinus]SEL13671.1 amino acid ABC transporter membrane protein 2, PAAT family [Pacificibacter marinus]SLN61554.1 Inner membrane amino-acid ABC transporter permease protein YecS [Pacificibacter marinus]